MTTTTTTMIQDRCGPIEPDDAHLHTWSGEPHPEAGEMGPFAWWCCTRCPARVLYDPETDDGFPEEPVVVYPPSSFAEEPPCGCPATASGDAVHVEGCLLPEAAEGIVSRAEEAFGVMRADLPKAVWWAPRLIITDWVKTEMALCDPWPEGEAMCISCFRGQHEDPEQCVCYCTPYDPTPEEALQTAATMAERFGVSVGSVVGSGKP